MAQFFSIQEAAQYLDVDYKVVYRLVREGKIPSTRVGWQFRITQEDLKAYLNAERVKQESTAQLLRDQTASGAPAANAGGSASQSIAAVTEPANSAAGVDKVRARQMEQSYVSRFQQQMEAIESIRHPGTGVVVSVQECGMRLTLDEDREGLMRALNSAFLDRKTLATTPHNVRCRGEFDSSPPFVIEARFYGHLATFCRDGQDKIPVSLDELRAIMQEYPAKEQSAATYIVGLASPVGWSSDAIDYLSRHEPAHTAVSGAHFLLLDLKANAVRFSPHDEVASGFAGLYQNVIEFEDMETLREQLLAELDGRPGLILTELSRTWGVTLTALEEAAAQLAKAGGVRIVPDKSDGPILVRV